MYSKHKHILQFVSLSRVPKDLGSKPGQARKTPDSQQLRYKVGNNDKIFRLNSRFLYLKSWNFPIESKSKIDEALNEHR
jgi:hypothetical protein